MNLRRLVIRSEPARRWASRWFLLSAGLAAGGFSASAQPWWDNFPRVVQTSSLSVAQDYGASAVLNGVGTSPSWGLWFAYGNDNGAAASNACLDFRAAGLVSLSYNEAYGQAANPIAELQWDAGLARWTILHHFWNWQDYGGGPIVWAGAWTWFDSFLDDPPANPSEVSYFARPFTRMHPEFGGGPMLYPEGAPATGFVNQDTHGANPSDSRVYDAGGSKTIYGSVLGDADYEYNTAAQASSQPHAGELWIPAAGAYSGEVLLGKDTACPCWSNYAFAETLAAVKLTGLQGTWTDNFSGWDSFMARGPVASGFGNWSVALFRQYLTNQFAASQLVSWGVLASNAPLTAIANFDVRAYLLNVASNRYGLAGTNLASAAWLDSAWLTNPVWSAYKIFRRQNGSAALTNYDLAVHAAAVQAGETNFAFLVNDQLPSSGGWARGTLDLASTELSLGWNITAGARGFGLPPFARVSPVYKAVREQGRSHFVNVWLYNDGYAATLTNAEPALALFYEMLATHALPHFIDGDPEFCGTPQLQKAFMTFVARTAAPALANRAPVEEVGLYLSTSTINALMLPGDAMNFPQQTHQYAVWGWGTALSELHYQYRIVPEWKLNASGLLPSLKVLIIPNAKAFEPPDVAVLRNWVSAGGCLLVTGDSGSLLGESGNFAPTNTLVLAPLTGVASFNVPPAQRTNFLGSGAVYYYGANPGYVFYNATAADRLTQLPTLSNALAKAFTFLQVPPALSSSNAPTTMGLTLYQDLSARKTFVDINNMNVGASPPYALTATPPVAVDIACPAWLTNGVIPAATILSPDGPLHVASLTQASNRLYVWLPPITYYASVILQPTNSSGGGGAPSAPSLTVSNLNHTVQVSWPADHLGWELLAQADGLGTNWFPVPGSFTTNAVSLPIDPFDRGMFYRLAPP